MWWWSFVNIWNNVITKVHPDNMMGILEFLEIKMGLVFNAIYYKALECIYFLLLRIYRTPTK